MERRLNAKQIQAATIIDDNNTDYSFSKLFYPSTFLIRGCCLGDRLVGSAVYNPWFTKLLFPKLAITFRK